MAVLIRGMEIPKNCVECRLGVYDWCVINNRERTESEDRPTWCPLVKVGASADKKEKEILEGSGFEW